MKASKCKPNLVYEDCLCMQTFNQTRHDHEITLEKQTIIELCSDEQDSAVIPQIIYHVSPTL